MKGSGRWGREEERGLFTLEEATCCRQACTVYGGIRTKRSAVGERRRRQYPPNDALIRADHAYSAPPCSFPLAAADRDSHSHRVDGRLLSIFDCFFLPANDAHIHAACRYLNCLGQSSGCRYRACSPCCVCTRSHLLSVSAVKGRALWPVRCEKCHVAGGVCSLQVAATSG